MESDHLEHPEQAAHAPFTQVAPPFAHYQAAIRHPSPGRRSIAVWVASGALGVLLLMTIGYYVFHFTSDPFRTLNSFPTQDYLADYERVLGSHFKANLIVDAELGGSLTEGHLYSFRDEFSQKNLAVVIPSDQAHTDFVKGQVYTAELEVGKGGLIYARRFQKK